MRFPLGIRQQRARSARSARKRRSEEEIVSMKSTFTLWPVALFLFLVACSGGGGGGSTFSGGIPERMPCLEISWARMI